MIPALTWTGALRATELLAAWAVFLQTCEMWQVRAAFGEGGIWDWEILRSELSRWSSALANRPFRNLLLARGACALALLLSAAAALPGSGAREWEGGLAFFLALSTVLIGARWRGTYNGGSDYLTLLVLVAVGVGRLAEVHHPRLAAGALAYVGVQVILSYFLAGLAKARRGAWWSGAAIATLLRSPMYAVPTSLGRWTASRPLCRLAGWGVVFFECLSPAALSGPVACRIFVACAILFHLANAYALGLNRFFWAWLAAYPALFFLAEHLVAWRA